MPDEKTKPFQMRVSPDWLATLDDWRRTQTDIPSRAEAIRRLVDSGLSAPAPTKLSPEQGHHQRIMDRIMRPGPEDDD